MAFGHCQFDLMRCISLTYMSAVHSLLFPAYSLTAPLAWGTSGAGVLVAVGLQCVGRVPNARLGRRCFRALGYGGAVGVVVCLFILMAFEGGDRPKLTPGESFHTALLGFATAGVVAVGFFGFFSWLSAWRGGGACDRLPRRWEESFRNRSPVNSSRRSSRG